jgi:cob(I)alamin adenosyltransferase
MKSGKSGETGILKRTPNINYLCPGKHPFIMSRGPEMVHYEHAEKALAYSLEAVERGTHLLICDEILDTILFKLLQREQILELIKKCKRKVELVMTGRDAPPEFMRLADYATEFVQKKHPYYRGARARKGIEF